MISKKKKTVKKATKKVVKQEVEEKIEDKKVEEDIPKRYYVQFWARIQPSLPQYDEIIGTIYWSDVKKEIIISSLHDKYATKLEHKIKSDIGLLNGVMISRSANPKEWVRNLHKANLGNWLYAKDYMEIVDETE